MIDLYTAATPNGIKISIALEELELPYEVHAIDLAAREQKTPEFLALNPNGKIPVIVDRDTGLTIFESGAILLYLAEKTGRLAGSTPAERYEVLQWLMFQVSAVGPMMGEANVYYRYAPERIAYAIGRYHREGRRLLAVLDTRLADRDYLAGAYSIADIANFAWARTWRWSGLDVTGLDNLRAWIRRVRGRPAVDRGVAVPSRPPRDTDVEATGRSILV